jgi:alkaline phosphatase D
VYPSEAEAIAARLPQPMRECIALADYRMRHASYRADPDLQALHAAKPMIVQWDDHETCNNSWEGGGENHQREEGEWSVRKAAAMQAWYEWLPVSDRPWATYEIGTLATFFRTESRLHRSESPHVEPLLLAPDPAKALAEFRDTAWRDTAATMLGSEQEAWLAHALARSVKSGQRWQVTAFGTIMGNTIAPAEAASWLSPDAPAFARGRVKAAVALGKAGLPFEMDNWGGYPAARARFLRSAQAANAELIVICGDSHNAWAYDLGQDGKPAGVEFAGHAVSSSGFEGSFKTDPKTIAASLVAANPELRWCDTSHRGYMALTLTPERATNDWVFVDTVRERSAGASVGHSATVTRGRRLIG